MMRMVKMWEGGGCDADCEEEDHTLLFKTLSFRTRKMMMMWSRMEKILVKRFSGSEIEIPCQEAKVRVKKRLGPRRLS